MKSKSLSFPGAIAMVALLALACSGDPAGSPTAPTTTRGALGPAARPDLAAAIAAKRQHGPALMAMPGVVGTGVGFDAKGEPAVKVFVVRPGMAAIPARFGEVPVAIEVTGLILAGSTPTSRARPAPNGFSVGHPDITAGTLGARVADGSGNVYILSNNHVLANSNNASIGDATLQPGPFDGGSDPADRIGTLADFELIDFSSNGSNLVDAAIALADATDLTGATPTDDGYGAPNSAIKAAQLNLEVQKYGRTTELTKGVISEIDLTVSVCYATRGPFMCAQAATFEDQIGITPGDFSAGGDSGSLIVTDDSSKNPVGLLFAGSTERTIANRIEHVLASFDVTVDPGDGSSPPPNSPPTATFEFDCTDLVCDFDASGSTDSDGTIESYDWDFGDGSSGTGVTASHTYEDEGSYQVALTVTDDDGAPDTDEQNVAVSDGSGGGGITLDATGYKVRGLQKADLTWSGATSTNVDVYRNGGVVATTANDGFHTDNIDQRGGGSYTYQVCEAGTSTCSNQDTVAF